MLRMLLEDVAGCGSLKRVISGGEALTPDLVERFFQQLEAELYNDYGPTETSIAVTTWKCRRGDDRGTIPIGRPIANVRLYILDAERNPVPIGVPGELYIGGVAVARGYLNRPELNAERFLPDPFSGVAGDTIYRTGDRCRWLPDGNVEFLGRRDGQVKIHGGRLELGEVEAAIGRHPAVAHAAVVVRHSSPDYKYLAAYVVPRGRRADDADARAEFVEDLRQFLKSSLPEYMIPQAFEVLDVLPKLSSGKVNRAALPAVAPSARPAHRYVAPRSPLEQQLAAIWADLLHGSASASTTISSISAAIRCWPCRNAPRPSSPRRRTAGGSLVRRAYDRRIGRSHRGRTTGRNRSRRGRDDPDRRPGRRSAPAADKRRAIPGPLADRRDSHAAVLLPRPGRPRGQLPAPGTRSCRSAARLRTPGARARRRRAAPRPHRSHGGLLFAGDSASAAARAVLARRLVDGRPHRPGGGRADSRRPAKRWPWWPCWTAISPSKTSPPRT